MQLLRRCVISLLAIAMAIAGSGTGPVHAGDTPQAGVSAVFTQIYSNDSYRANTSTTPYRKFDIVYVAFVHVNPRTNRLGFEISKTAGTVRQQRDRLRNIQRLTAPLRQAGKLKIVISLGFGDRFNDIPRIERNLRVFAPSVRRFLAANKLDGFDIDYEEPTFSSPRQFARVSRAIRSQLGSEYLFTITPNNTTNLAGSVLNRFYDYVNVQSYVTDHDAPIPVSSFVQMPGLARSKITAGADVEGGDRIGRAINDYRRFRIGGVFAWQLEPNFQSIANQMRAATR